MTCQVRIMEPEKSFPYEPPEPEPAGFAAVKAPVMSRAMRRANAADLRRLKELLESGV